MNRGYTKKNVDTEKYVRYFYVLLVQLILTIQYVASNIVSDVTSSNLFFTIFAKKNLNEIKINKYDQKCDSGTIKITWCDLSNLDERVPACDFDEQYFKQRRFNHSLCFFCCCCCCLDSSVNPWTCCYILYVDCCCCEILTDVLIFISQTPHYIHWLYAAFCI